MKAITAFVMKGRMRAVLVATVLAVLALLVTPLGILSAAVIGLAVLQQGWKEGLLVLLASMLGIAVFGGLLFGQPAAMALMGLSIWLPAAALGTVMGRTQSLARTLEATALLAGVLVGLQYLLVSDPVAFWASALDEYLVRTLDPTMLGEADRKQLVAVLAAWMPGGAAATWFLGTTLTMSLVRAGSFALGQAGGFGAEFRDLRFSRPWLLLAPVLLVFGPVLSGGEPNFVGQLYLVGMALFLVQGVSVAHGLVAINGSSRVWLVALYGALFLLNPHGVTAVAAAGYADGWIDFRARARARAADRPDDD